MKKRAMVVLLAILVVATFAVNGLATVGMKEMSMRVCLQDQYGDVYDLTIDRDHNYIYGTVTMHPDFQCDARVWYITGSYARTSQGPMLELTAANPLGDADTHCVATYKVKGIYPNAAWYYTHGYGGQEFTWQPCGAPVAEDIEKGGIYGSS